MLDDAMNQRDCKITRLTDRGVMRVSGEDARDFLQGLITSDMGQVAPDAGIHAALLTPQGKILFDFFVAADDATVASPSASRIRIARRVGSASAPKVVLRESELYLTIWLNIIPIPMSVNSIRDQRLWPALPNDSAQRCSTR